MRKSIIATLGLAAGCVTAVAQPVQLPIDSSEKGTVYVKPNLSPTENSTHANGGTVGVVRPDGAGMYGGMDTSGALPTYSAGASTGGKTSFSAGAQSDGKTHGAKAGVTIKY
jgi:hypothetical protein